MKLKLISAAILAVSTLGLSGCVLNVGDHESSRSNGHWEDQQQLNRTNLTQLAIGMTKEQVLILMGTADFNEAFSINNSNAAEEHVQVFFYRTQWSKGDGKTTKDECTPLVIKNNQLVGWGDAAYRQI